MATAGAERTRYRWGFQQIVPNAYTYTRGAPDAYRSIQFRRCDDSGGGWGAQFMLSDAGFKAVRVGPAEAGRRGDREDRERKTRHWRCAPLDGVPVHPWPEPSTSGAAANIAL